MKKTITILSALAVTGSPALALNIVKHKTQNLQTILKPATAVSAKPNGVVNDIIVQAVSSYHFYFQVRLSNSTYNGFPAYVRQIAPVYCWPLFFFQWLDDDNFSTSFFPELNHYTKQGFWHDPMVWSNRFEEHMGHFGAWNQGKSCTAYNMLKGSNSDKYLANFSSRAEEVYYQAAATGKVAGIMLNFGFLYANGYTVEQPNFELIMNS